MKLRIAAMAGAIVAGAGLFLGAQRVDLIHGPWSHDFIRYADAADADPGDYMGYYRRGLHFQKQGQLEQALAELDHAVALSPTPLSLKALGDQAGRMMSRDARTLTRVVLVYAARAEILQQMNRASDALADLDHAVALDSHSPIVIYTRGLLRSNSGRYDEAIADFDYLLTRHNDVDWFFGRGMAKYLKGDFADAAADFGEAAQRAPRNTNFQSWLTKATTQVVVTPQSN